MNSILLIHIISASILTIGNIVLLIAAVVRLKQESLVRIGYVSFGTTLVSGMGLVFLSPNSLTHLCGMMTVYSLATFATIALYKKRTARVLLPREINV